MKMNKLIFYLYYIFRVIVCVVGAFSRRVNLIIGLNKLIWFLKLIWISNICVKLVI